MADEFVPGSNGARRRWELLFTAAFIASGAAIGGLYAHFIGCRTGTCPITSSVRNAALYGGFVGAIIGWPRRRRDGGP